MGGDRVVGVDDPDDYARVRDVLDAAGYTDEGIDEMLGARGLAEVRPAMMPVLLRRTAGDTPLETLIRLFVLGAPVDLERARRAIAPMTPEAWARLGLLHLGPDGVVGRVQLGCHQGLVVAFDARQDGRALPRDHVMGMSASSLALAGMTVRRPNQAALDVGTGSGLHALLAADHSGQVVATDLNRRAVEMARFNAGLNGLANVECLEGDLLEPVEGRTFDLVVSNPPFIISPHARFMFLESGLEGDEVCRRIVGQVPPLLNEGGYCQLLANWVSGPAGEWQRYLAGWFENAGCDVWVIRFGTQTADEYAAGWLEDVGGSTDPDRLFAEWTDALERQDIRSIGSGLVTMRRAGGRPNWFRAEDSPETMSFPCGDDIAAGFELREVAEAWLDDDALLAGRPRLAAEVVLQQLSRPAGGGWQALSTLVRGTGGLQYPVEIGAEGTGLLAACDGTRPLGDLLGDLARSLGVGRELLVDRWLPIVRQLVDRGLLVPGR